MALSRGVKLHQYPDDWLYLSPITRRCSTEQGKHCEPNSVLGVDNQPGKHITPTRVFSFMGYEYNLG